MTLSDDVCRCHDARCEVREYCERWLQRNHGSQFTRHAETVREGWTCLDEFCRDAIPVGDRTQAGVTPA